MSLISVITVVVVVAYASGFCELIPLVRMKFLGWGGFLVGLGMAVGISCLLVSEL